MGLTSVTVAVSSPLEPGKAIDAELIVDTGSILTWISGEKLGRIDMKPRREKEFKTIEGRIIRRSTGPATLSYDGSEADVEVVFAEKGDAEVLGVTALEGLGYRVDPVSLKLEHVSLLALRT